MSVRSVDYESIDAINEGTVANSNALSVNGSLELPSQRIINAAIDLLLSDIKVNQRNIALIESQHISRLSADTARTHMEALITIANNCLRDEAISRSASFGKHLNSLAAVSALPRELTLEIFSLVILDPHSRLRKGRGDVIESQRGVLSRVCWSWYLLIREYPAFWTSIANDEATHPIAIHRSLAAPLDITYTSTRAADTRLFNIYNAYTANTAKCAERFFRRLDTARSRWQTAVIKLIPFDDDAPSTTFEEDSVKFSEADLFSNLFGPALRVLDVWEEYSSDDPAVYMLPLGKCPSLKELDAYNISIEFEPVLDAPLPSLIRLSLHGFSATTDQWRTILSLIAASKRELEELDVTPSDWEISPEVLTIAEVDAQEVQDLELPTLRKLKISQMPPHTFNLFIRRTTLNLAKLTTLDLWLEAPLDETLALLSDPFSCSISRAIRALSAAEAEVQLSATFGRHSDSFSYQTKKSREASLRFRVHGPQVVSRMLRDPSMFNYPHAPRLHVSLSLLDLVSFNRETLVTLLSTTPHTTTCKLEYGTPSNEVVALLKGTWNSPALLWPELTILTLYDHSEGEDDSEGEDLCHELLALMANRAAEAVNLRRHRDEFVVYTASAPMVDSGLDDELEDKCVS